MNQIKHPDAVLGIDISKATFKAALLRQDKFRHKSFSNQPEGFNQLADWLAAQDVTLVHACLEATSHYSEALAEYLFDQGMKVSVVNPARLKGYAQSELVRTKTDKTDAALIARFCAAMKPARWQPEPKEIRVLRAYVRRLDALIDMRQQERNRLEAASEVLSEAIEAHITYHEQDIKQTQRKINDHIDQHPNLKDKKQLLESIPGIGPATINVILSEFAQVQRFQNAKHLASFIGVAPRLFESGTSVRGRTRMSKIGRSQLRKAFFLPAMVALRYNPIIKSFGERLLGSGKTKMQVIGAAMRKLIHIVYGVLKSGVPFDENYFVKTA